jgi:hypothetical protein
MKTKTYIMALLCLISNVALAGGSVNVGFASDFFRRGALVSEESLQSSVSYNKDVAGLNVSVDAFTDQALSSGNDSYIIEGGASQQIGELLGVYVGLQHFEQRASDSTLEVNLQVDLNVALSPSLSVFRDTSDDLYTFEVSAKHGIETQIADLCVHALYGNTDVSTSANEDYYGVGAIASKSISDNSALALSYDYVDSDLIADGESVFGVSFSVNF